VRHVAGWPGSSFTQRISNLLGTNYLQSFFPGFKTPRTVQNDKKVAPKGIVPKIHLDIKLFILCALGCRYHCLQAQRNVDPEPETERSPPASHAALLAPSSEPCPPAPQGAHTNALGTEGGRP
jgi:hypothetical protein